MGETHEQASTVGGVSNLLMGAMGGVMVPVFVMPDAMQKLAAFSPMNWGLEAFLEILLRQGDFQSVWPLYPATARPGAGVLFGGLLAFAKNA